jgi:hypothetical protein
MSRFCSRAALLLLLAGSAGSAAGAQEKLAQGPLELKRGSVTALSFQAPQPDRGKVVVLQLEARLWGTGLAAGGSAHALDVRVNDQPLRALPDRVRPPYLRNKPPTAQGLSWYQTDVGWRVPAAPSFDDAGRKEGPQAFRYVLEIGHLLQPGANKLELAARLPILQTLFVRNIELHVLPVQPRTAAALTVRADQPAAIDTAADGAVRLSAGGRSFTVASSFSVPGGGWLRLGPPPAANQDEQPIHPTSTRKDQERHVEFRSAAYAVKRRVRLLAGRAWIEDAITNLTDKDLGMMVRHELLLPGAPAVVHLGGNDDPSQLQTIQPCNPTIFIPLGDVGLGLVAEDDVLREQGILLYRAAAPLASLRTERLALPPRATVKLQWSSYALPKADYFDFVNRIRADWGVAPARLDGPYWWHVMATLDATDAELQAFLERNAVHAAIVGSWLDVQRRDRPPLVGLGAGVMSDSFADYRQRVRAGVERIRRLRPGVRVGIYNHFFFNWPQAGADQFRDSWVLRKQGESYIEKFGGLYSPAVAVFPTLTNSFGAAFKETLARQRQELGVDGFYFDETNGPGRLPDPITFGTWDRHSALLHPKTFAIEHKIGYINLLSKEYQTQLYDELRGQGLSLLGNDQPHFYSFNRDTWPRFTETENLRACYRAHLYTPLAFTYGFDYTVETLRARLEYGLLCCVTTPKDRLGIVAKFFPITPLSIHQGWVHGQERVVTARSGKYGWAGEKYQARLWRYTTEGALVEENPPWRGADGLQAIDVPPRGIAILERRE